MTNRMAGKRIFATAAGQGIGKATVLALLNEGAEVIATDINPELLAGLPHHHALTTQVLDVTDGDAVRTAISDAGAINGLFNCAGVVHHGTILDSTEEQWQFAFDLNVHSQFSTTKAALPGMIERGSGSIVNMSSVLSSVTSTSNRFLYTTSKAAVVGLTKAVAADHVTQGIRCNCICPGTVESPSLHERLRATGDYDAAMKAFIARQPMGRIAHAEEVAALALYLLSDESAFTTGQAHVIDGGWAI